MRSYPYLIIGGGMTADAAIGGIRRRDKTSAIGMLSDEPYPPYKRPPLSKGLWLQDRMENIWCNRHLEDLGVDLVLSTRVTSIDPKHHLVIDHRGETYGYNKLLLAVGGRPVEIPQSPPGVIYFRGLDDYLDLRQRTHPGDSVLVLGGGFVGSEIAAVLATSGLKVTMVFAESELMEAFFPTVIRQSLTRIFTEQGVHLIAQRKVVRIEQTGPEFAVTLDDGQVLSSRVVVGGLGLKPNTELAIDAGLAAENGIVVNEYLETSAPDIYAAGDVASFPNVGLNIRRRVEHEDNAVSQGRRAGENMAGPKKPYLHLPFFYSDLFHYGYEAIGLVQTRLTMIEDWTNPGEEGVVYYLDGKRVVGVLNWGVWDGIKKARDLIVSQEIWDNPEQLKGVIRNGA